MVAPVGVSGAAAPGKRAVSARTARNARGRGADLRAPARPGTLARMSPPPSAARVRRAHAGDIDALCALEEATFTSDRISRAQWRHQIGSRSVTVLVGGAARRVDAAAVVFYRRTSRGARLYSLAVDARAQRTGLGGALLAAAEADARRRGCTAMHLEVRADNAPAIALYEHRGYVRRAALPGFYEDGADGWRYVKALAPAHRAEP